MLVGEMKNLVRPSFPVSRRSTIVNDSKLNLRPAGTDEKIQSRAETKGSRERQGRRQWIFMILFRCLTFVSKQRSRVTKGSHVGKGATRLPVAQPRLGYDANEAERSAAHF